jgi:hypothetical protein
MSASTREALLARLHADPDAAIATLEDWTDTTLSVGAEVWRLAWRGQATTAVAADAPLSTTCGALLDAIALHESGWGSVTDRDGVNVLVDRPPPADVLTEVEQAVRSLRSAAKGFVRVWYSDGDRWQEDTGPAPSWNGDLRVEGWVKKLLLPRLHAEPSAFAVDLVEAVGDPSAQLYPSEITKTVLDTWTLRIDGLEIGTLWSDRGTLRIGQPGKGETSEQRRAFREVFGADEVTVGSGSGPLALDVAAAAEGIRRLLARFRGTPVAGAPVTHRGNKGVPFVDEHALEARLLKGLVPLVPNVTTQLVRDDARVARGSQFPTLWGHGGPARYLDALVRRDATPLAVELKVPTGGQGRYYRRAISQAVLYRHFILSSPGLDPWFQAAGLDRLSTEAIVGIPTPVRYTARFGSQVDLLERIAKRVGVELRVLDDRVSPDWNPAPDLPEVVDAFRERLTWRFAAALSARWPRALGRACDMTDAGGFYDLLSLQPVGDLSLDWPAPRPRIRINRHGSLWVFNQLGGERWVWRALLEQLADGHDPGEAAEIVGRMAGLWPPERPGSDGDKADATFAQLASEFLALVEPGEWHWRNAWLDGNVHDWVDRFKAPLRQYRRTAPLGTLPTIARIWGALSDGEARMIVDQENFRVWVWRDGSVVELAEADRLARIGRGAALVSAIEN